MSGLLPEDYLRLAAPDENNIYVLEAGGPPINLCGRFYRIKETMVIPRLGRPNALHVNRVQVIA